VLIVTQRKAAAERADKIMIIRGGVIEDYGPKASVAESQNQKMQEMQMRMQTAQQAQLKSEEIRIKDPNVPAPEGRQ
jgi:ABC-type protease/lipase transport system fused ATPase/permease subunit